jgi:hypothetical protein
MNLHGSFLVMFGESAPPQVRLLSAEEMRQYSGLMEYHIRTSGQQQGMVNAAADMFGDGAEFACPTWGVGGLEAMTILAHGYIGPHAAEVQRLCACIVTGLPFNPDAQEGGPEGGTPALLQPAPPEKPPGGASVQPAAEVSSKPRQKRSKVNVKPLAAVAT